MTITYRSTLVGVFQSRSDAVLALDELNQAGFESKNIDFAFFRAGRAIVTVHAHGRVLDVWSIFVKHGAQNIHSEATDSLHPANAV